MEAKILTRLDIEAGMSSRGGWSEEQLAIIGVPWPPEKWWKRSAIGRAIAETEYRRFLELKDAHLTDTT